MDVAAVPVPIALPRFAPLRWAIALWPAECWWVHCFAAAAPAMPEHWPIFHLPVYRSNVAHVCSSDDVVYRWKGRKKQLHKLHNPCSCPPANLPSVQLGRPLVKVIVFALHLKANAAIGFLQEKKKLKFA